MALVIKTQKARPTGTSNSGWSTLDQWIQVSRPAALLPQTSTDILYRVAGGRVVVRCLLGEVTVLMPATDAVLSVSSKALSNASVAIGTAVVLNSTVTTANREVGGFFLVNGAGTAIVASNAGAVLSDTLDQFILPQGEVYLTGGASTVTGQVKWDIFYQPLDPGAYVYANPTQVAI